MTTSLQSLSYLTANLAAGRNPQLEIVPLDATSVPAAGGGGYPVTGAMLAYLRVALRENAFTRTCYYFVSTADLTATYTVIINGTTVTYNAAVAAPANLAALLAGIAAAINANATLAGQGFSASAADYDGDGTNDSVRITRTANSGSLNDYAFAGGATGSAVIAKIADACGAVLRLYDRPDVAPASNLVAPGSALYRSVTGWCRRPTRTGALSVSLDGFGYCDPNVDVSGCAALWPALSDGVGHPGDVGVFITANALVYPKRQESSS